MTAWVMEEFAGAELGDGLLRLRLIELAARFNDKHQSELINYPASSREGGL